MSYRIRFTLPDGRTGLWAHDYTTREAAQAAIDDRLGDTGFSYAVEEVPEPEQKPEPTSTTERLVGLLRDRHARGLAKYGTTLDRGDLTPEQWAEHAIDEALDLAGYLMRLRDECGKEPVSTAAHHVEMLTKRVKELVSERVNELEEVQKAMRRDLAFAIQIGDAMHRAMTTAQSRFYVDWGEIKVALAEWTAFKDSLAASLQGTDKASQAPGEGGDSDRRRLEALRAFLDGNEDTSLSWWGGEFYAVAEDAVITAPTLAALADKLAEKEAKP